MRQRAAVHVFQLTAQWHAMGQAAGVYALLACKLRQVMCSRFTFHSGIGGDDQLGDHALRQTLRQRIQAKFAWAYAIQWLSLIHI